MIKDFETVRTQLKELAEVINAFKSEAVQLRIIDLVFGGVPLVEKFEHPVAVAASPGPPAASKPRKGVKKAGAQKAANPAAKSSRPPPKGRPSGNSMLKTLVKEGFFKSSKTLKEIVDHCDTNRATKYNQSNFSGPLMRQVRENNLTRKKNADGQYEYFT